MSHPIPARAAAGPRPAMPGIPMQRTAPNSMRRRRLDRAALHAAVAARTRALADAEIDLVAACERAAARGLAAGVRIDDRETWDRATWDRYLAAAASLEPEFGPRMRRLYREIDQLNRLLALPLAA